MNNTLPGHITTFETRSESYEKVDKDKRYKEIKYILSNYPKGLTAKQIAVEMKKLGYASTDERNLSSPRLTELLIKGEVDTAGKIKCEYTGKTVSVFKLRKEIEERQINLFDL